MGKYVNQTLSSGEQVLCTAHYHWTWWVGQIMVYAFVLALFVLWSQLDGAGFIYVPIGILLAALGLGYAYLRYTHDEIVVTSHRVVMKTGIVSRDAFELQIRKVESILVDQSVLGRLLNFGAVTCRGTGGTASSRVVIAEPLAFRAAFQDAVAKASVGAGASVMAAMAAASSAVQAVSGGVVAPGGSAASTAMDSEKLDEIISLLKEISAKLDN